VLLQAIQILMDEENELVIFDGLGSLPLFNPDIEGSPSSSVLALWSAIEKADAIVFASPEYAHGVTGTIKNALDWLVGYIPFAGKPVAVLNPSHRSEHADAALREILRTMAARLIPGACLRVAVTSSKLSAQEIATDSELAPLIHRVIFSLENYVPEDEEPMQTDA